MSSIPMNHFRVRFCDSRMGTFFRFSIFGFTLIWLSLDSTQGFWGIEPLGKSEWTTGYSMQSSHEIAKNAILTTLPRLTKEWRVSFEVMPSEYKGVWENLLYMTTGGDRSPALWLHKRGWVYICSVIDGKKSNCKQLKIRPVVAGRWTKIEVSQVQVGANHIFSLTIGDQKVLSRTNSDPEELHDVIVYSARYPNLKGYLQKLKIDIKSPIEDPNEEPVNSMFDWETAFYLPKEHTLKKRGLLTTLPTLTKEWKVSFELRASSYQYKSYAQILQMTIGGKSGNIGDRTPALWIHKTRGVYLATSLSGNSNYGKFFKNKKPPTDEWTSVEISQTRRGSKYMFTFVLKGETLWDVENKDPRQFSSIKVLASSSWYAAQAGSIRGLKIEIKTPGKYFNPLRQLIKKRISNGQADHKGGGGLTVSKCENFDPFFH